MEQDQEKEAGQPEPSGSSSREDAGRPAEERAEEAAEESSPRGGRVTIISDPGRTSYLVRRLLRRGPRQWGEQHEITHRQTRLPLRSDGTLDVDVAQEWAREESASMTVVITELPRIGAGGPKSAELHFSERLAIISLPVQGPVGVMHGLRRELDRALVTLRRHSLEPVEHLRVGWRLEQGDERDSAYITPRYTWPARVWMTLGIAVSNEPMLSLPKLSGVFAAASATGAFGVFYGSIWGIAEALPSWRLAVITGLAILGLVLWLMLRNRLWDGPGSAGGRRLAVMYTVATVLSLLVSVAMLYLLLFAGILVISLLLIDPTYLAQTQEGLDGTLMNYVDIAWLAASMGTVAGAIGSNFDPEADLEGLTQGSRELRRYPRDAEQR